MNMKLNFNETKSRSVRPTRPLNFKLAAALASVCVGAGLLLPVVKNHSVSHHAMPSGQFRADMQTLVAAVRYLLAPDPALENPPVLAADASAGFAHLTPNRTLDMPDQSPPRTETAAGSSTNPPAPI